MIAFQPSKALPHHSISALPGTARIRSKTLMHTSKAKIGLLTSKLLLLLTLTSAPSDPLTLLYWAYLFLRVQGRYLLRLFSSGIKVGK